MVQVGHGSEGTALLRLSSQPQMRRGGIQVTIESRAQVLCTSAHLPESRKPTSRTTRERNPMTDSRTRPALLIGLLVAIGIIVSLILWRPWQESDPTAQSPVAEDIAAVPDSLVMIPGYGGGNAQLQPLAALLREEGTKVVFLDIGDGTGDLRGYASDAVASADRLRAEGAQSVAVLGYSAGGITARIAATDDPEAFSRVITLASPHQGTTLAELGSITGQCPEACQQMRPGSDLLTDLPGASDSETWLSVYSTTDEVIIPPTSSELDGATVLSIQSLCTDRSVSHSRVPTDSLTTAAVSAFLQAEALPLACPAA